MSGRGEREGGTAAHPEARFVGVDQPQLAAVADQR
jgi:hypothetical protein